MFNPVTTLTIDPGQPNSTGPTGNHIVVYNQSQVALLPSALTWSLSDSLAGVTVTPDTTGFFFSCPVGTAAESGVATATYTQNGITGTLTVNVVISVSALQFSQE